MSNVHVRKKKTFWKHNANGVKIRGDAAGFQSIFPGYGADNHEKLKTIAKNYDPEGVFQNLMPGGFKIF